MNKFFTTFAILTIATPLFAQTSLIDLFDNVWEMTKADAANGVQRREYAGYVTLDTSTGEYGLVNVTPGPWVPNNTNASMRLPVRPKDIPENPSPVDTAIYVVAWFHTHTPTTFVTFPYREVGPSQGDFNASIHPYINMPGFAYDYVPAPANGHPSGTIPAGHPINSSVMLYPVTPPERRPTP